MKVLLLSSQANFITQIVSFVKQNNKDFIAATLNEGKTIDKTNKDIFNTVIEHKVTRHSLLFFIKLSPKILKYSFLSLFILILDFKQGLKSFKCLYDACGYIGKIQHADLKTFDIVNIHYLTIKKAIATLLFPKQSNIIVSFWGSDIFRTSGLCYNFWLRRAIKRSNTLHVSSFEMRTSLLSEFGYGFKNKIKFALFVPSFEQIKQINAMRPFPGQIGTFKTKYNIAGEKCLMIGNNAKRGNNHIEILNAIKDVAVKHGLTIILPLTYGKDGSYIRTIREFTGKNKIKAILLTEYLPNEDLAAIRIASDIFITMQETDAMSGFLTESLYAGNICIAASWLPYSKFRQSGAYYHECPRFDKLGQLTSDIVKNIETEKQKCKKNPELIKATFYDKDMLQESWGNIYKI